jgi:hypothetical protein
MKRGDIHICGYKDCVCRNDGRRGAYKVLVRKPERKRHLQNLGIDGRIIFKWVFKNRMEGVAWTGLIWPRIWAGSGLLSMW